MIYLYAPIMILYYFVVLPGKLKHRMEIFSLKVFLYLY